MDVPEEQAAAPKSSLQPAAPMKIFVTASRTVTLDVEPRDSIATVALLVSRKCVDARRRAPRALRGALRRSTPPRLPPPRPAAASHCRRSAPPI